MTDKKKVAILFSGRISCREADYYKDENYKNFENFILKPNMDNYDFDIFICYQKGTSSEDIRSFVEKFNPKIIFENDEYIDFQSYENYEKAGETTRRNVVSMFYCRKKLFEEFTDYCKRYNLPKYDLFISKRVDLNYSSNLNLEPIEENCKNHSLIMTPNCYIFCGMNDQYAIMNNFEYLEWYMKTFDNIHNLCRRGIIYHPETLLREHLDEKCINFETFDLSYKLTRLYINKS
jgi:hypothetical protein